jgi:hypothetical protein
LFAETTTETHGNTRKGEKRQVSAENASASQKKGEDPFIHPLLLQELLRQNESLRIFAL